MSYPKRIDSLFNELIDSELKEFPKSGRPSASNAKGVYIIYDKNKLVLHVGSTPRGKNGINQRLYNHLTRSSSFYKKYLKVQGIDLRKNHSFKYIEIDDDARKRGLLESLAIGKLCPKHFGTGE